MEPITQLNCTAICIAAGMCMQPDWKIYWEDLTKLDWPHLGDLAFDRFVHGEGLWIYNYYYFNSWLDDDQFKDFLNFFGEYTLECLKENPNAIYPFIAIYDTEEQRYLFSNDEEKLKIFW